MTDSVHVLLNSEWADIFSHSLTKILFFLPKLNRMKQVFKNTFKTKHPSPWMSWLTSVRCHPGSCLRSRTFLWWGMASPWANHLFGSCTIYFDPGCIIEVEVGRDNKCTTMKYAKVVAFPENKGVRMVLVGDMFQLLVSLQIPVDAGRRDPPSCWMTKGSTRQTRCLPRNGCLS